MATTEALAQIIGVKAACATLQVPRRTLARARRPTPPPVRPRPAPALRRALRADERATVRATLNSERFQDCAPREVYAALLERETYLCSVATMYRILGENTEIRERRNQLRHPAYLKPELLATAPNQVWTWDTLAPARKCRCYQAPRPDEMDVLLYRARAQITVLARGLHMIWYDFTYDHPS